MLNQINCISNKITVRSSEIGQILVGHRRVHLLLVFLPRPVRVPHGPGDPLLPVLVVGPELRVPVLPAIGVELGHLEPWALAEAEVEVDLRVADLEELLVRLEGKGREMECDSGHTTTKD